MYNRSISCCFTGHRPEKLPWGQDECDPRCIALKDWLREQIEEAYALGYRHFFTGMALGCDLYFCEALIEARQRHPDLTIEAAVPCPDQADLWSRWQRDRYLRLLELCDKIALVSPVRTPNCMMLRNRYMVDRSFRLIAVFDGAPGGTMNTLAYAMREGLEIVKTDPTCF